MKEPKAPFFTIENNYFPSLQICEKEAKIERPIVGITGPRA
jgi:hypothetical protein